MIAKWSDQKIPNSEWKLIHHNRLESDNWIDYHRKYTLLFDRKRMFESYHKTQDEYLESRDYKNHWLGLFKIDEKVYTSLYQEDILRLSPKPNSELNYRTDALIQLSKSINVFSKSRYSATVFTFEINFNSGNPLWETRRKHYPSDFKFLDKNRLLLADAIFEIKPKERIYDWHDVVEDRIPMD